MPISQQLNLAFSAPAWTRCWACNCCLLLCSLSLLHVTRVTCSSDYQGNQLCSQKGSDTLIFITGHKIVPVFSPVDRANKPAQYLWLFYHPRIYYYVILWREQNGWEMAPPCDWCWHTFQNTVTLLWTDLRGKFNPNPENSIRSLKKKSHKEPCYCHQCTLVIQTS